MYVLVGLKTLGSFAPVEESLSKAAEWPNVNCNAVSDSWPVGMHPINKTMKSLVKAELATMHNELVETQQREDALRLACNNSAAELYFFFILGGMA